MMLMNICLKLADGVISITQAANYAETIYDAHIRRQLILVGDETIHDANNPSVDAPALQQIETAEAKLFKLAETSVSTAGLSALKTSLLQV